MTDYATLLQMAATIVLVVAPAVLLNRLLAGDEGSTLTDILAIPIDPPWPRGVQEEEPVPWRVERLARPGARPVGEPRLARGERAVVESGPRG